MVRPRRASGALEAQILRLLWANPEGMSPGEVHAEFGVAGRSLAYTTVMTVLTRLWTKGTVGRMPEGRTFRYVAINTEAETAASRMRSVLDETDNRRGALANFVADLSSKDEQALRDLLRQMDS